jgi:hypothetical protein
MKKITVFLFAVLLILSVNGNATEREIINLVSFDNSLSAEKNNIEIKTTSEPESEQSTNALPEPIALFILGFEFIVFGLFWRKTLLQRCLTCPLT